MPDGTYAPQSPDLSSFLSSSTPPRKPQTSSYAPRSPNLRAFTSNAHYQQQQHPGLGLGLGHGEQIQHQQQQQQHQQQLQKLQQKPQQYHPYNNYGLPQDPHPLAQSYHIYQPPIPDLPPSHSFPPQQQQQQPQQQRQSQPVLYSPLHQPHSHLIFKSEPPRSSAVDHEYPGLSNDMPGRGKRQVVPKLENNGAGSALGPSQGIEVKTKFPVARIKRIMQADEEVGKVAQVTPVAVSKALELFMISLVTKSANVAKEGNSKRVTAQHLKKAIAADEQFDFLSEIVSRVVEGPDAGGKRVKDDEDSEEDDKKAPKKSKGRRKKGE